MTSARMSGEPNLPPHRLDDCGMAVPQEERPWPIQ